MTVSDILSLQLWTLRDVGDLPAQLAVARQAGYDRVETIGGHLADPGSTRRALAAEGLAASSSHVALEALRDEFDAVVEACQTLEIGQLFLPAVPMSERGNGDAAFWEGLGAELGSMADRFTADGILFGYHNHDWDFAEVASGTTALDALFAGAGSSALTWQADIAWIARSGTDPESVLNRHGNRLVSAHVKDIAPVGQNLDQDGWCDVGAGTLDWPRLWPLCRSLGAQWMVVEHDKPADASGFAKASRIYLDENIS